jgi:hypothetical protein
MVSLDCFEGKPWFPVFFRSNNPVKVFFLLRTEFFAAGFGFFSGFLVLCFPASLLLCLSAFLLFLLHFCFSAFLLFGFFAFPASPLSCFSAFCFSCFSASLLFCSLLSLLLCFSVSLPSLLLCFSAFVPFYFYYSTYIFFFQSCVLAAILPAQLLLCLLSSLSLCFSFYFALFSPVCILNETLKRP